MEKVTNDSDYEFEKKHLKEVIDVGKNIIDNRDKYLPHNEICVGTVMDSYDEYDDLLAKKASNKYYMDSINNPWKSNISHPYFGRIDAVFNGEKKQQSFYIGNDDLKDNENNIYVISGYSKI